MIYAFKLNWRLLKTLNSEACPEKKDSAGDRIPRGH